MKRIVAGFLSVVMVMGLAGCGSSNETTAAPTTATTAATTAAETQSGETTADAGSAKEYDELNLRISVAGTEQGVDAIAAQKFADDVAEASDGKIKITVYPSSQLAGGDLTKMMELFMAGGSYEMCIISGIVMSNVDQRFLAHTLPFEFKNYDEVNAMLDGSGGEYYTELLETMGIVSLGAMHNGLKQYTNNKKEILTPDDMKGLKIRVPSGTVSVKTMQALGADPVTMAWSEVYTALQQGTVDGHENSYQTIYSANIQEVQKYVTELNWQYDGYWFMVNQNDWNGYSEDTKELLTEKAAEACEFGRNYMYEQEVLIKDIFEEAGVTISVLTEEQRQAFIDATAGVRAEFIQEIAEACAAWNVTE